MCGAMEKSTKPTLTTFPSLSIRSVSRGENEPAIISQRRRSQFGAFFARNDTEIGGENDEEGERTDEAQSSML